MADAAPVVLVTGATSGLGRYLACALAGSGWRVLVHGRDPARVADLAAELGGSARGCVADLASLSDVRDLATQVRAASPRLDVLVNNAAVGFGAPGEGRQLSADGHELRFAVNYLAPVLLTRLLVPMVAASAPSRILNIGSIGQAGFDPADARFEHRYNGVEAYRRSKLALAAFTFDLAEELRAATVTVNCSHPATLMNTTMVAQAGITPVSTLEQGGEATVRLITDPALDGVTGQFFDGLETSRARPEAYDPQFRARLREVTGRFLGGAREDD
ncbi:MAG: SDR family NAD(P)-dependent oxidoreductase [Actinomycetota bacterium]|nr:SDR family NAD(P)-dependent oxidoreductase [Actinomycetota bacterium]